MTIVKDEIVRLFEVQSNAIPRQEGMLMGSSRRLGNMSEDVFKARRWLSCQFV